MVSGALKRASSGAHSSIAPSTESTLSAASAASSLFALRASLLSGVGVTLADASSFGEWLGSAGSFDALQAPEAAADASVVTREGIHMVRGDAAHIADDGVDGTPSAASSSLADALFRSIDVPSAGVGEAVSRLFAQSVSAGAWDGTDRSIGVLAADSAADSFDVASAPVSPWTLAQAALTEHLQDRAPGAAGSEFGLSGFALGDARATALLAGDRGEHERVHGVRRDGARVELA